MTPLALKIARDLHQFEPNSPVLKKLVESTCFDLTPVAPLTLKTVEELCLSAEKDFAGRVSSEHGGLLFLPAEEVWIEQAEVGAHRYGAFVSQHEGWLFFSGLPDGVKESVAGALHPLSCGERFSYAFNPDWMPRDADEEKASRTLALWVAASLMLINAPRGVDRIESHPHKGLAKRLRATGFGALRPYHTIRLSPRKGDIGATGDGLPGSPKAFHFCRSHVRRLATGATTRVKAHWRGDPSLGVCRADYEVAA